MTVVLVVVVVVVVVGVLVVVVLMQSLCAWCRLRTRHEWSTRSNTCRHGEWSWCFLVLLRIHTHDGLSVSLPLCVSLCMSVCVCVCVWVADHFCHIQSSYLHMRRDEFWWCQFNPALHCLYGTCTLYMYSGGTSILYTVYSGGTSTDTEWQTDTQALTVTASQCVQQKSDTTTTTDWLWGCILWECCLEQPSTAGHTSTMY